MKPIAERTLLATHKETGEQKEVTLEIFAPRPVDDGKNYFCLARIVGIDDASFDTGGVDGIQALSLAVHALKTEFMALNGTTYDFFWHDGLVMDSFDYLFQE